MGYLENYLNRIVSRGNEQLAASVKKTAFGDALDLELRPKKFHAHDIHLEQLDKPHLTQIEQSSK